MKVYVLLHNSYEDRAIFGVYARREDAEWVADDYAGSPMNPHPGAPLYSRDDFQVEERDVIERIIQA